MMKTEVIRYLEETKDLAVRRFTEVITEGGLAAFPTETVYGLGGNGLDPEAAKKIYLAKGRPSDNPLILHIGRREQLDPLVREVPEKARKLMDAFWPGPLTLIFEKSELVPRETTGGLDTVAVRMPSNGAARALLSASSCPIAAPSANLSGKPSPTSFEHVMEDMNGRIDLIIDGGDSDIGVESTIIDLSEDPPVLLRPGYVTLEMAEQVIGEIRTDPAIRKDSIISHTNEVLRPKAPGMKYRHYAPKAPLYIICGESDRAAETIAALADENCGIIASEEHRSLYTKGIVETVGSLSDPERTAHNLFQVLRRFDKADVRVIYSEDFPDSGFGAAVMNRLLKAAGGNYMHYSKFKQEEGSC